MAYLTRRAAKGDLKNSPADAIPYLLKAAKFESDLKKNPLLYLDLAAAYNDGPRARLTDEYKAKYTVESPESKLALANINQFIDRQIDAMARAAALASNAADKKTVMDALTETYKDRNNKSDAGLNELVAGILAKPLPEFPTPLTSLPTPTPVSTPGTNGSPTGTNGTTSSNTATNGQTRMGSTGASGATGAQSGNKTTSGAKPATPTPSNKPKPRRANHSRG